MARRIILIGISSIPCLDLMPVSKANLNITNQSYWSLEEIKVKTTAFLAAGLLAITVVFATSSSLMAASSGGAKATAQGEKKPVRILFTNVNIFDGFCDILPDFLDEIILYQDSRLHLQLVAETVKDVDVGKQDTDWFIFPLRCSFGTTAACCHQ